MLCCQPTSLVSRNRQSRYDTYKNIIDISALSSPYKYVSNEILRGNYLFDFVSEEGEQPVSSHRDQLVTRFVHNVEFWVADTRKWSAPTYSHHFPSRPVLRLLPTPNTHPCKKRAQIQLEKMVRVLDKQECVYFGGRFENSQKKKSCEIRSNQRRLPKWRRCSLLRPGKMAHLSVMGGLAPCGDWPRVEQP